MAVPQSPSHGEANAALRAIPEEAGLLEMALQPEPRPKPELTGAPNVTGYEMINWLGSGSSGEVWLAEELETGRIAALKILHRHGIAGASEEVLQREIRMLATLVHPNLVAMHRAVTTDDGRQGLAMEWIDGWPLGEWLEMHPDLPLDRKLLLFRGMVRGVAYLHEHGVIHRDLKPANLIVDAQGVAKIVDFGLARLHREGTSKDTGGGSIGVAGTLHFMAPEQAANGDGARAMPVDVYALGLVLHRILTGAWLIPAEGTPTETLALVLDPPPLALHGTAKTLPRDLLAILRQALAPDPAHRYRHAGDLEADLDRFTAKLPVAARKQTFLYLTASLLRRQARRSLLAGCVVLAGLAASGAIYLRHRKVVERNEANLRYAYTLTSFSLGQLRDELRTVVTGDESHPQHAGGDLPGADDEAVPALPLNAAGELDLLYYQALLADLRSATSEGQARYGAALKSIRPALDLYSQLALEAPNDPKRLLDAARARLSFARMLERTGRLRVAGGEARKTLKQLDRLADWPGFDPAPLLPLRCDVLRLLAKEAHHVGDSVRAFELARDMQAAAESLPGGLLVRPENETMPRLALATHDLVNYALSAGPAQVAEARRDVERVTAICRAAHEQDPQSPPLIRGLAYCLNAQARLDLHEGRIEKVRPLLEEGETLLISEKSVVRLYSFPVTKELSYTATAWAGAVLDHPDPEVTNAALLAARRFTTFLQANGAGSEEIMIQRARLYLYESLIAARRQDREQAARAASRAVRLLRPRQLAAPDQLPLALLTAAALHQLRAHADASGSEWEEKHHGPQLNRLLQKLVERSAELSPAQQRELSLLK